MDPTRPSIPNISLCRCEGFAESTSTSPASIHISRATHARHRVYSSRHSSARSHRRTPSSRNTPLATQRSIEATSSYTSARGWTSRSEVGFFVALVAILAWRPLNSGIAPAHVALYIAFLALWIVVPGRLVLSRVLRCERLDWLHEFGLGTALGLALLVAGTFALRALDASGAIVFYPLVFAPLFFVRARSRNESDSAPSARSLVGLLAIVAFAVERTLHFPDWWKEHVFDLLFHVGNAAEFAHSWPLRDPRFAGLALNYHVFAYALPAGAARVSGAPIAEVMLCTGVATFPALLAIQLFNAGRAITRSVAGALIAALIVLAHADIGTWFTNQGYEWAPWLRFGDTLDVGLYMSYSTCSGLFVFAAIAVLVERWFARARSPSIGDMLLVAALGFLASGVKGSVMPVVIAGVGLVLVWRLVRERRIERRALALLAITAIAALPVTAYLMFGKDSYAGTIFRWSPAAVVRTSGFFRAFESAALGENSASAGSWSIALTPLWLCGYLGLTGVGAWLFLRDERARRRTSAIENSSAIDWLFATALIGAAFGIGLIALGFSQLFFFYNGQIALALLAGAALARRWSKWSVSAVMLALLALVQALGVASEMQRNFERDVAAREPSPPLVDAYRAGLDWMRAEVPANALVVARHDSMLISAYGERRAFYESADYTGIAQDMRWIQKASGWGFRASIPNAFPERRATLDRFFADPSTTNRAALEDLAGEHGPLYVVVDAVRFRYGPKRGHWCDIGSVESDTQRFDAVFGAPVFANEAMRVYTPEPRASR